MLSTMLSNALRVGGGLVVLAGSVLTSGSGAFDGRHGNLKVILLQLNFFVIMLTLPLRLSILDYSLLGSPGGPSDLLTKIDEISTMEIGGGLTSWREKALSAAMPL